VLGLLDPEHGGSTNIRNDRNESPNDTETHTSGFNIKVAAMDVNIGQSFVVINGI
jgi:Zn-dependent M16 (insulinase) family peptidase